MNCIFVRRVCLILIYCELRYTILKSEGELKLKAVIFTALFTIIAISAFCTTSNAITGNSKPDSTPYVCVVVLFSDLARTQAIGYSTGVLISPTVVLTAGHCVLGGVAASVCFDQGPITWSIDQNGMMTYNTNQPIYNGVPVPYPAYAQSIAAGAKPSQALQTSDVGVIVLDKPVKEVSTYATLPKVGFAGSLPVKTDLQVKGYGVQYVVTPLHYGVYYAWQGTISRNSATSQLLSTNFNGGDKYLKITANSAQGKGGAAYGDSGGPVLYSNIVLAVNAYVNNANCAGVTFATRIDTAPVLSWISGYL